MSTLIYTVLLRQNPLSAVKKMGQYKTVATNNEKKTRKKTLTHTFCSNVVLLDTLLPACRARYTNYDFVWFAFLNPPHPLLIGSSRADVCV